MVSGSGVTTAPANPASGGGGILGGRQIADPEPTSTPCRYKTCREGLVIRCISNSKDKITSKSISASQPGHIFRLKSFLVFEKWH